MLKFAKGGRITIESFLDANDRELVKEHLLKTASTNFREAAKIGLQSLYANPDDVFKKYKDFDIVKEMQSRKGAKLLWVRARAIDADVVNANGDYFGKDELLKEVEIKGEKIPSYKTFEGVPIYTNHKNDDIEQAKGMVVYAEWDEEENCVFCTYFVDEEAYPDIARNIRTGVIHDVSMGASVEHGICSNCSNKAYTEKDYCDCLKKWKGKKHPSSGKHIYEKNYGIKFIELSCVGDGAFESCEIEEIYDVDEILQAAGQLEKKANQLYKNITVAFHLNESPEHQQALEIANNTVNTAVRLAQTAGTLVGGQLLAQPGAGQNATVGAVMQALGIDPRAGLNILDLINLSLNFLEVAVMNMFSRKDNIDLAHVGKITKSMADLQSTMQDIIDDGVDTGQSAQQRPINQPQQAAPQQQQPQQMANLNYTSAGNVGRMLEPAVMMGEPIGGGITTASDDNAMLVWASKDNRREVFASTKNTRKSKFERLAEGILSFKSSLVDEDLIKEATSSVIRSASGRNTNIKTNAPQYDRAEGKNQMDHFAKIASEQRKRTASAVTIDFKVEDGSGNRVVLSTDGSISGYHNNVKINWEPSLTENALVMMESGQGTKVASELLKDLNKFVKTALLETSTDRSVKEVELEKLRTNKEYKTINEELGGSNAAEYARKNPSGDKIREEELAGSYYSARSEANIEVIEKQLADAGLYANKVKDEDVKETLSELVAKVNKGVLDGTLEERLSKCRAHGTADAETVMITAVKALAKAVVAAMVTPDEIMDSAGRLAEEPQLPEMVETSALGTDIRSKEDARSDFFKEEKGPKSSTTAILEELGDAVSQGSITAADLAEALKVAVDEGEITKEGVTRFAELLMADMQDSAVDGMNASPSRSEELKAALSSAVSEDDNLISKEELQVALASMGTAANDTGVTPDEIVDEVAGMDENVMRAHINHAKTASVTEARAKSRARRQFWGQRFAAKQTLTQNLMGWFADYSENYNIKTSAIVRAAKKLVEEPAVAEKLISKAITAQQKSEKTAAMNITQEKFESVRFYCCLEDLGGIKPSDDNFEDAFKNKAIEVLQSKGFTVDPGTFAFTDLSVTENGDVTATVSSRTTKTFKADDVAEDLTVATEPTEGTGETDLYGEDVPVIMTENAVVAAKSLRSKLLERYAQMAGMGGAAPQSPAAGPIDQNAGMDMGAMGGGDLGLSAMTADDMAADEAPAEEVKGEKAPWGSICPVCASKNVDIDVLDDCKCNECGSRYKITQTIELLSSNEGEGGTEATLAPETEAPAGDLGLGPDMGLGAATAPAPTVPGMPAAPAPGMPMAAARGMFRLSATVDPDPYLRAASADFNRDKETRLPVGMICPACGNRHANKVKNSTFCGDCGTMSRTTVTANKKDPSKLDVTITWID
jgi:hypothetical protein